MVTKPISQIQKTEDLLIEAIPQLEATLKGNLLNLLKCEAKMNELSEQAVAFIEEN